MLRSKFGLSVSAALLVGALSMTGCSAGHSADNGNMQTKSVRGTDGRIYVNSTRDMKRDDDFGSMEMSKELADRVAAMPEVRSANVIMVGRSAYVAVMLEHASGGVHTRSTTREKATGRGTAAGVPGMTGTGGSMAGIPGSLTGTGTVGGTGMAAPEDYPGNGNNGIMSRSNMGDDTDLIPGEIKNKIAAEVKKGNTYVGNVYVSANPDFVDRADYYAREFRAGHPLRGFANEFRIMAERIFPARSGQ
ncbi:YhcN/YlaJ family sporulation lipoprotein [Paenibacillus sp. FSL R7-0179]|uniref:YhcN/YlaJ family sporulation lipoprotein n=1 Tax=Paenibacillus sp. FSL R7-0179 TaxID=2921672 RepID=UPI0030F77846